MAAVGSIPTPPANMPEFEELAGLRSLTHSRTPKLITRLEVSMSWGSVYLHRQRAPRVSISLPIEYDSDGAMDSLSHQAAGSLKKTESRNISEGGLLLILPDKVAIDSTIVVKIHVPIKYYSNRTKISPILAKARVVWTDLIADSASGEYHCGICFTEIAPEDLELLREFISRCLSSENPLR